MEFSYHNVCYPSNSKMKDVDDITCPRVDMNFIFECSIRYLTSECSGRVKYRVGHEKIKFISTSGHVVFCLVLKNTRNDVFDNFPKISDHFPKISEYFPKLFSRLYERFRTFFEDFRTFLKVTEEGPMIFRSYNNTFE